MAKKQVPDLLELNERPPDFSAAKVLVEVIQPHPRPAQPETETPRRRWLGRVIQQTIAVEQNNLTANALAYLRRTDCEKFQLNTVDVLDEQEGRPGRLEENVERHSNGTSERRQVSEHRIEL